MHGAAIFMLGTLCGSAAMVVAGGGKPGQTLEGFKLAELPGAILLFEPTTWIGKVINAGTGRNGFSHSALFLGHLDHDGMPLLIDTMPVRGVHVRRADSYDHRTYICVVLSEEDTEYAREKAQQLLKKGAGYRGKPRGMTCSEMVMTCLPPRYRRTLQKRFFTPNDIAQAFRPEEVSLREMKSRLMR